MLEPTLPTLSCFYCWWKPTRKANAVEAVTGVVGGAVGRTQVCTGSAPGAAPKDTVGAIARPWRINNGATRISTMPIRRPFSYIAVHIKKAPRVGFV